MKPKPLTAGQVAELIGVDPRQVGRWCDDGKLRSYRLPGRGDREHRRIRRDDLVLFCEENRIPIPPELREPCDRGTPLVLVGAAHDVAAGFVRAIQDVIPKARWRSGSLIDLGFAVGHELPLAVLLGCDDGLESAVKAAARLLTIPGAPRVLLLCDDVTDSGDVRIDSVRKRLAWIGRRPSDWQDAVTCVLNTTRNGNGKEVQEVAQEGYQPSEPPRR